jgi:hypothetical protein
MKNRRLKIAAPSTFQESLKGALLPTEEGINQDFNEVKERVLSYAKDSACIVARANRSYFERLLSNQETLFPLGAYVWALSAQGVKLEELKEAPNTKILQWVQERALVESEQEILLQLVQKSVDNLADGPRKERITEALSSKNLHQIQRVIHENPLIHTLEEILALGNVNALEFWLQTNELSPSERG